MKNNTSFFVRTGNKLTSTPPTLRSGTPTPTTLKSGWSNPDTGERGDETAPEFVPDPDNLGPAPKPVFPQTFPRLQGPPIVYDPYPYEWNDNPSVF